MPKRERYSENKSRVYEIYGIDEKDPNYNCHHICFKRDAKKGRFFEDEDLNEKGNLIPMLKTVHSALHKKVDSKEGHQPSKPRRRKEKPRRRKEKPRRRRKEKVRNKRGRGRRRGKRR